MTADTPLLGNLPELDSMAVVELVARMEGELGIRIHDDEISAETFATLGSLTAFVDGKL
jgi:acyl carrier protein